MNKSLGASAGAILLAAALLRTTGSVSTPHELLGAYSGKATQLAGRKSTGEGPWVASCEYWAPARPPAEPAPEVQTVFSMTLDKSHKKLTGVLPAPEDSVSECGDDVQKRWGLPASKPGPDIKTLTAIVPDPVRTNMALQFDRTIDALMAAAGEYQYYSSYYWLPWKEQSTQIGTLERLPGKGQEKTTKNEHEPGLIIFKSVPLPGSTEKTPSLVPENAFAQVLYLFLVAETPTTGIDGLQIQKAFQYQDQLADSGAKVDRSFGYAPGKLAIIGPTFSGSAASLRQAVETMLENNHHGVTSVSVNGATGTELAVYHMTASTDTQHSINSDRGYRVSTNIEFRSFSYDSTYSQNRLLELLTQSSSSSNPARVAVLAEDGTAFGRASAPSAKSDKAASDNEAVADKNCPDQMSPVANSPTNECQVKPLLIRFPRGIFLLRNAQAENGGAEASSPTGSSPSPYLHLTLKDANSYDSVPQLSRENTPLSQEAQLMTIARQLQRHGSQYIVITATSVLDQLFLAQFLHRACPDARLVFYSGDLLFEREIDNVPFVGTITFTPYPLISTGSTVIGDARRAYSDSIAQAYFNAASYTIWDRTSPLPPLSPALAGYRSIPSGNDLVPPLWVTAIGSDGYYPLGIAGDRATDPQKTGENILPVIPAANSRSQLKLPIWPTHLWYFLCIFVCILCVSHSVLLCVADPWSPVSRELAFKENDQPRRRAMYVHTGTAMLFCMAFVVAIPLFPTFQFCLPDPVGIFLSGTTFVLGTLAVAVTFWKTRKYIRWESVPNPKVSPGHLISAASHAEPDSNQEEHSNGELSGRAFRLNLILQQNVYLSLNMIAWVTLLAVPSLWSYLCFWNYSGSSDLYTSNVGLFFSFRCVHPESGVSPLVPVLLLLFSWYTWAVFHTWRLRFSDNCRPILPGRLELGTSYPLFVADEDLCDCDRPRSGCLYKNITCLLITREALRRFLLASIENFQKRYVVIFNIALVFLYLVFFASFVFFIPVKSLDALFWASGGLPTPYEFLVTALFFPLLVITLTGWLRMIFVWAALKRSLLERLENLPIRFAFSRLNAAGWMTMLRRGGLHEQWRDMARCTESMRQMIHDPSLDACIKKPTVKGTTPNPSGPPLSGSINPLIGIDVDLNLYIRALVDHLGGTQPKLDLLQKARELLSNQKDLPVKDNDIDLVLMNAIERCYASFSEVLLGKVLVPYWKAKSSTLVESEETEPCPKPMSDDPRYIRVAEEFLAIRYLSLIRAVLVNIRYLIVFVSLSFVLAIVAWNSYPFQPRQFIDWVFTGLLAALGCGAVLVFAQMHRDPILNRITHTKANELGVEFYIRIIAFGAVPVLTWLAYQFPEIGGIVFKFLKPGIEVIK